MVATPQEDIRIPDWQWWKDNQERLEEDVKKLLESQLLQNIGHPPGPTLEITARGMICVLDKHPQLATGGLHPNGKPLSASEKRKQRRFERNREPDEVIEIEAKEGEHYKIIPNSEYVQPPSAPYVKNGERMPDGWTPISMTDAQPALKEITAE